MIDVDYEEMLEANIDQDIDDIHTNQESGILTIEKSISIVAKKS